MSQRSVWHYNPTVDAPMNALDYILKEYHDDRWDAMNISLPNMRSIMESDMLRACQVEHYMHLGRRIRSWDIHEIPNEAVVTLFRFFFRDWDFIFDELTQSYMPGWRVPQASDLPQHEKAECCFFTSIS